MHVALLLGEALGFKKKSLAVCGCGQRVETRFVIQTEKLLEIRCSLRTNRKKLLNHTSIFIKIIISSIFIKQTVIDAGAHQPRCARPHAANCEYRYYFIILQIRYRSEYT